MTTNAAAAAAEVSPHPGLEVQQSPAHYSPATQPAPEPHCLVVRQQQSVDTATRKQATVILVLSLVVSSSTVVVVAQNLFLGARLARLLALLVVVVAAAVVESWLGLVRDLVGSACVGGLL